MKIPHINLHPQANLRLWLGAGVVTVALAAAVAIGASRAASIPSPNQLWFLFEGQKAGEQQGVSVAASTDPAPLLLTGLQTAPTSSSGNHISARGYSGVNGTQLVTVSAALQFSTSINTVAVIGPLSAGSNSAFVVGTPRASAGGTVGVNGPQSGIVRLFDNNGTLLHVFNGTNVGDLFGQSVAAAGDVNGDGVPDILIGAPGVGSGAGAVYVYSGNSVGGYALIASIASSVAGEGFGTSVARIGLSTSPSGSVATVVAIGAPLNPGAAAHNGRVYVYSISRPPVSTSLLYSVAGSGPHDLLGMSVDGGRDLNGDNIPDFLGGAIGSDVFGPTGTGYVNLYSGQNGALLRTITSSQTGDLFGYSAQFGGPCFGAANTVIAGAPQAFNATLKRVTGEVSVYNAANGAAITSILAESKGAGMGTSVANAPDLTGDGETEFLVGTPGHPIQPAQYDAGDMSAYSCRDIPRPKVHVSPAPVNFGGVNVGALKKIDVHVSNIGTANLAVLSAMLTGGSNPAYSLVGPIGFGLAPGAIQTLTVVYAPTKAAINGATLRVVSSDPLNHIVDVPISGQGLRASLQVTPTSIAFNSVDVSDTAWAKVSMQNVGNVSVTVSAINYLGGTSADFTLAAVPSLPLTLQPLQSASLQVIFKPTAIAARTGMLRISSNDPVTPAFDIPVSGNGVKQNVPPTAVIDMNVPYAFGGNFMTIHFLGQNSFDPDDAIVSYAWNFGDGSTSALMNPSHGFAFLSVCPCYYIVRLTVTDAGGKSDVTSVTVPVPQPQPIPPALAPSSARSATNPQGLTTSLSPKAPTADPPGVIRSRFWGTAVQNGSNLPEGTVVQAWVKVSGVLTEVAESLTQIHLGKSVYAIEVPPYNIADGQLGGADGVSVTFRINGYDAGQVGTWWNATDQRLDLSTNTWSWVTQVNPCIVAIYLQICNPNNGVVFTHLYVQLIPLPRPIIDPGPLDVVDVFQLNFTDANTGGPVTQPGNYAIHTSYTDGQLLAAAILDQSSLHLYYASGNQWVLAGADTLDAMNKQLITNLNHASVFALMGRPANRVFLPMVSHH